MGKILGLHHICIITKDIDESLEFYCNKIGFTLLDHEVCHKDGPNDNTYPLHYALLRLGHLSIELLQFNHLTDFKVGLRGVIDHFGLDVENIEEVIEDLRSKGVAFISDRVTVDTEPLDGYKAMSFTGPSGEVITLYEFVRKI